MLNKNISIWRGSATPPTNYHLWEKEDGGLYVYLDEKWQHLVTPADKITLDEHQKQLDKIKNLALTEINPTDNNTYKSYQLKSDDNIFGTTINIPKDRFIKQVILGYDNATIDESTGIITIGTGLSKKYLLFSIALESGSYELVSINLTNFLTEKDYSDGLEVVDNKLKVKVDPSSEEYLKVSSNGIKVEGIDTNFNKINERLTTISNTQIKRSEMGVANGVATLDENGLVPSSQLPSFVDDVLEFDLKDNFPTTGETGKIYVAKDSNLTYRWSGTQYIEISASLALGETSSTAYAGDKGKDVADKLAKVRNTQLSHIKDTDTFSATAEKVSLNYDCYVGDQYGAEATSHSVDIPVASETQAGIITAEDKKAIIDLDTTYAKKADVDKSIKDLSDSIAAGEAGAVVSLAENSPTAYAKSYVLSQGNKEIGTINIPKDMVVSSGSLKSVTSANDPYTGAKVGDKYIDLVIANSTSEHIYIPISDLIDIYLAGDGLTLENSKFSIKKDAASESYLTVSADGVRVSGIDSALEGKVDKEEGKSLVLTTEITKLAKLNLPDAELKESENTVQNKAVKAAIDKINTALTWTILD